MSWERLGETIHGSLMFFGHSLHSCLLWLSGDLAAKLYLFAPLPTSTKHLCGVVLSNKIGTSATPTESLHCETHMQMRDP